MLLKLVLIGVGGGIGSVLRALIAMGAARYLAPTFPFGTLMVNVLGCLVAGVLAGVIAAGAPLREEVRAAVLIGLCGGFTTFSAFGIETVGLASTSTRMAALNVGANVVLSLAAATAGFLIGRAAAGPGV